VWAVLYQQVENLTMEPRISGKAVDVNPAVSFGAVLLGAALFGVAGAFVAVPIVVMLLALLDIYGNRYELLPELEERVARAEHSGRPRSAQRRSGTTPGAEADRTGRAPGRSLRRRPPPADPTLRLRGACGRESARLSPGCAVRR
jgi:hypothetical protein